MDAKAEKLALFRYGLIASLVIETLPRGELTRRAQEIAARHYDIPDSKRTAVSIDTLLDWAGRYRNGGFEALAPKPRQDRGQSRAVTPQLASLIERLKRENPHRTGTTLLRELALSSGASSSGQDAPALSASRCIASSNNAASQSGNCSHPRYTRSLRPNSATRSGIGSTPLAEQRQIGWDFPRPLFKPRTETLPQQPIFRANADLDPCEEQRKAHGPPGKPA